MRSNGPEGGGQDARHKLPGIKQVKSPSWLGKNMIGAFHQPEAVVYHTPFLQSLPEKEWRSGYAEVIKHALIGDVELYHWLKEEVQTLADLRDEKLIHILTKAIPVKANVVSQD
ncbi:3-dehydroquinate synthase family protein, partial [Klebsiella pneumoniae]|uniref:3-dehydroquinate synthase family protein n=1 Tax=Klebsiella pneumoniae TaxID=573 RepID=UPI002E2EA0E3|nr:hypothetical protein [Klebsiella pneumoniae]